MLKGTNNKFENNKIKFTNGTDVVDAVDDMDWEPRSRNSVWNSDPLYSTKPNDYVQKMKNDNNKKM